MSGEAAELIAHQQFCDEMKPYERLLGDAMRGDNTLFTRADSVEAAWRVIDPVLNDVTPLTEYQPGTWGPPEADRIVTDDCVWRNPVFPRKSQT